jgi:nucleotidyltransferase substrate binding protein (TIGR01987 family)
LGKEEKLKEQVALLRRAVARLASALAQPKDEFVRDSAIQRFAFTFEFSWKTLKTYLELQGLEARSPRAAIREAFATGLLPEDPGWLAMVELRNLTSHTYEEELAEQVYAVLARLEALLSRLEEEGF